ncbi:glycosyltransferase family 2 protein [Salidesulfovibrio onnuriiensis]|uniref:glycosyltransferase family 2 protein n=1 Tax=Salidesulfovibrio onnuriiensis TaxID=2583823 RepID=UPI0011CA6220|nr:glycosyltransferase family 2 protein [Salidesulfovibrio onnuriiensis]
MQAEQKIAVVIPCYNEAAAIAKVVDDFRTQLVGADIYVFDNNSSDDTAEIARKAGAIVRNEPVPGKGNVVRRMFADVEADIYVLVDGDDTYDAPSVSTMVNMLLEQGLDMVVGVREEADPKGDAYRAGHSWGNKAFNRIFAACFGNQFTDIFSGFRVFSRRFVKSFPALSSGFEIETEMSIHAVKLLLPTAEYKTTYYARPEGSYSKLNTYQDGLRILWTIFKLFKEVYPFRFFCSIAALFAAVSLGLGLPIVGTWIATGLVPRFPTAILAMGIMLLSAISLTCGLILDSVARNHLENKRLKYLTLPAPRGRV